MKRLTQRLLRHGRALVKVTLIAVPVGVLLLYRLTTLTPGLSPDEASIAHHGVSLQSMYSSPLNLPLHFLQWLCFGAWHSHSLWLVRLPDVILAAAALVIFALLLRRWYGMRTALFGSVLLAFSPWFLHVGRTAGVGAEQLFAIPMAVFALVHLNRDFAKTWAFYGSAVVLSLLLYVPGMAWFIGVALVLQILDVKDGLKHLSTWWKRLLYPLAWLLPATLLIWALVRTPSLWRSWLALPMHFDTPLAILKHVGSGLAAFVWHGPNNPALWLDRLPILNVFTIAMVLVGILFYARHWLAPRTRLLFIFFVISMALYAVDSSTSFNFAVPLVYSVAAAGIGYLMHEWLTVFPRNPLARGVGTVLIVSALALSCLYNVRQYYVAWPHNPRVQAVFQHPNQL
ncbi:MAG TPA: hypothetical protein VHD60_04140 [Candidatus Saccharimonadales bacterium]|nr:hypothetical protein [Candidatus Saccharimonadales bacterium]